MIKDIKNQKFGRLKVLEFAYSNKKGDAYWLCQCDCGKQKIIKGASLREGSIKSCGCLLKESTKERFITHNLSNHILYPIWSAMKARCYRYSHPSYKNYGGRGIKICEEWKNSFQVFYDWAIANGYKEGLSIDRINNNGNYEPSNCRWATRKKQQRNIRRNVCLSFNNQTHCISEWAEMYGIKTNTFYARLKYGWSLEKILNTPVNKLEGINVNE